MECKRTVMLALSTLCVCMQAPVNAREAQSQQVKIQITQQNKHYIDAFAHHLSKASEGMKSLAQNLPKNTKGLLSKIASKYGSLADQVNSSSKSVTLSGIKGQMKISSKEAHQESIELAGRQKTQVLATSNHLKNAADMLEEVKKTAPKEKKESISNIAKEIKQSADKLAMASKKGASAQASNPISQFFHFLFG